MDERHPTCVACGLHAQCASPFRAPSEGIDVLVVISKVFGDNDTTDPIGDGSFDPYRFVEDYLNEADGMVEDGITWDYCNPTLCPTFSDTGKIKLCQEFFHASVRKAKPKVILAFGNAALDAVQGKGAPKGIQTYTNGDFTCEVFPATHPSVHFTPNSKFQKDLTVQYERVFGDLVKFLKGAPSTLLPHCPHIVMVNESGPGLRQLSVLTQTMRPIGEQNIALDIETNHCFNNPDTMSSWMPGIKIISVAAAVNTSEGTVNTVGIDTERWTQHDFIGLTQWILENSRRGRTWLGSNFKFDMTNLLIQNGWFRARPPERTYSDMLTMVELLFPNWEDTFIAGYLRDQSMIGNGLKELSGEFLGAPDWDRPIKEAKKASRSALWHYGLFPREDLVRYNCLDVYYTLILWEQHAKHWAHTIGDPYTMLKTFVTDLMVTEWVGFPADKKYFEVATKELENSIVSAQKWLDDHPYTRAMGWKEFNCKSSQKKDLLARALNLDKVIRARTDTGMVQINKKTIKTLIKGDVAPVANFFSTVEFIRQQRDRVSKFFKNMVAYNTDGVIHTDFKVCKDAKESGEEGTDGAETGRLSTVHPSLHNAPKSDALFLPGIRWKVV